MSGQLRNCGHDVESTSRLDTSTIESEFSNIKMRYRRRRPTHSNSPNGPETMNDCSLIRPISSAASSSQRTMRPMERYERERRRDGENENVDGCLRYGWNVSTFSPKTTFNVNDNLVWSVIVLVLTLVCSVADGCSTRPSPKPRPPRPMWTPDLGSAVVKENCTDDYAELYCMNGGKCYRQKILETFIVNCECQPGFVGTRCQYRDVPDKYLPVQQRIETASIAGGVFFLVIIVTIVSASAWLYYKRRRRSDCGGTSSLIGRV